jgi:NAD-dependent SIR2 family protein deacetylase
VTHQDFLRSDAVRQRYWARSLLGWPVIAQSSPNAAHAALAALETAGLVRQIVTQNVDGLHQRAGNQQVIDLHGRIGQVICLDCGALHSREAVQTVLQKTNPGWSHLYAITAPDGDADLDHSSTQDFRIPTCANCDGMLKPDVVFYGDAVPRPRVEAAMNALQESDAMLVVGSSLSVYSGYRFCLRAQELGLPILAINQGRTRADELFTYKSRQSCTTVLSRIIDELGVGRATRSMAARHTSAG